MPCPSSLTLPWGERGGGPGRDGVSACGHQPVAWVQGAPMECWQTTGTTKGPLPWAKAEFWGPPPHGLFLTLSKPESQTCLSLAWSSGPLGI